ncbi:MAG: pyridoxal-phosphate dependent enzyme [Tannerella sp.]|jgi:threonine synthase|nr:pyridoxal-phosphate dependent enzyme [Tannerella sp.]
MKYYLKCCKCSHITKDLSSWFGQKQFCPDCGGRHVEAVYHTDYSKLKDLLKNKPDSFWNYFDFLPIENKENIVSFNEGAIMLEEWNFLNRFAMENYGINCHVYAYRNDLNGGTNTLKDVAASLTASALKENGISRFCVASTGNTATANARYLAKAGIKFTNFAPSTTNKDTIEEIRSYGQEVRISDGDYAQAKQEATEFSEKNNIPISIGNIDPLRVESKRTMVFEFIRQLGKMPDVYMQAVGGGSGPIALDKGFREIEKHSAEIVTSASDIELPRMLLVQQDMCDPMVQAWELAKKNGFPENFENDYPKIENPPTSVFILSAGNPGMYPLVARIVKKGNGDFLRVKEAELLDYARIVYKEKGIHIGPAATVCFAGFYQALKESKIKDGETIVLNIGESGKRYSDFISKF